MREGSFFIQPYNKDNGKADHRRNEQISECLAVTAAVLLVKKEIFELVGGFDEAYLYGYEDVDLCLKIHTAGYRNYYCPYCLVFHYEFGTQSEDDKQEVKERRSANMRVFKGKWQKYLQETLKIDDKEIK